MCGTQRNYQYMVMPVMTGEQEGSLGCCKENAIKINIKKKIILIYFSLNASVLTFKSKACSKEKVKII